MHHLRGWLAVFLIWVVFFFSLERFGTPITLTPLSYVFAAAVSTAVIVLPRLHRFPLGWAMALLLPVYLVTKVCAGYPLSSAAFSVTLAELAAVEITFFISTQVRRSLEAFREAVTQVMTSQIGESAQPFEAGQSEIYRELCRARHYKRPLALLAISIGNETTTHAMHRFVEEMQRESIRKYVTARLAQLLAEELKACDILAQRDGHFLTLLPETAPKEMATMVQRLETAAMQKLGLELCVGSATFPDQEVTFEGLVERAEAAMRNSRPPVGVPTEPDGSNPDLNVVSIRIEGADARHVTTGSRAVATMLVSAPNPADSDAAAASSIAEGTR